jgi:hypothetical protein
VELEWKEGGQSDVAYYTVKYQIELNEDDQYASYDAQIDLKSNENDFFYYENTTNTKYRIQNRLRPFKFYVFQVIAVNEFGESDPSQSIRVQTAASSKDFIARN